MSWETQQNVKEEKKEMKIEFKNLKDVEEKRGLKIGLYGDFANLKRQGLSILGEGKISKWFSSRV